MTLEDAFILEKVNEAYRPPSFMSQESDDIPLEKFSQFSLRDLLGERIVGIKKIKNTREYDSKRQSPNPEYFDVLEFESGGFLLVEEEGWQDGTTLHSFYYNGKITRYSDKLFDGNPINVT